MFRDLNWLNKRDAIMLMFIGVLVLLFVIVPGLARLTLACGYCILVLALVAVALFMITGCAELKPVSVPIEYTHVSHLTQHFGDGKSDYGYNSVAVGLKWKLDPHLTVVLSEGLVLDQMHYYGDNTKACGSLGGGREVFTGKVTYEIPLR